MKQIQNIKKPNQLVTIKNIILNKTLKIFSHIQDIILYNVSNISKNFTCKIAKYINAVLNKYFDIELESKKNNKSIDSKKESICNIKMTSWLIAITIIQIINSGSNVLMLLNSIYLI